MPLLRLFSCLIIISLSLLPSGALAAPQSAGSGTDKLSQIEHIVVIYEENHSFDNLYGGWEGVNGLANADAAHTTQINQAGGAFTCLKQDDVNLTSPSPLATTCTDSTTATSFPSAFTNNPFKIDTYIPSTAVTCPKPTVFGPANGLPNGDPNALPGGCTRDLVHRYYQEQYQLDGGTQDHYVTGSDAIGLTMGYYDTTALPIYKYLHQSGHPRYAILDNFFQAAFGGSFLNHQWLIAAATPIWANALNDGSSDDLHSALDANGMPNNYPLYTALSAVKDQQLTQSCNPAASRPPTQPGFVCGDYAVNTSQPAFQPYSPGTAVARRLPALTTPTIGDRLNAAAVDWAWYAGGWSNANGDIDGPGWTNGHGPNCSDPNHNTSVSVIFPYCPDGLFQYHHQPFNYFAAFDPTTPTGLANRTAHLRDEQEFIQLAQSSKKSCMLKPVSFVKPIGEENEHPGYTGVTSGSNHLVALLQAIEGGKCKGNTLVIVTYDEFGGQWDHVSPPGQGNNNGPSDQWGPGTRIPALVIAQQLKESFVVDHTEYDTTSILRTIEQRFGLAAVGTRDAAVNSISRVFNGQ